MGLTLTAEDLAVLKLAKERLEHPSLAARLTDLLALPIEKGLTMMPRRLTRLVQAATRKALEKAMIFAVATVRGKSGSRHSRGIHKAAVMTCGATGGAFGLAGLVLELPVSTVIMLRSISAIARSEGEDPRSPETMMNCLQVFALGGRSDKDDASETGYYAVRAALSRAVTEAAQYISRRGVTAKGAPVLVRFITAVASRFGIVVSEKAAAMAVPAVGAVGGCLVNAIFMDHFQNVALGHFAIRRLERTYGADLVQSEYRRLSK